jgi:molecular chaperone DnaJ
MNLNKNYYNILGISNTSNEKEIKKAYYKLSKVMHPDKGGDSILFNEITESYDILCSERRSEYDQKSKFGNNYNEYFELFNINIDFDYDSIKSKRDTFKKSEINDIIIEVDDKFDGVLEFERWVKCKTCDGTGKDLSSKIVIRDNDGNILKMFDGEDGCDLCEGSGEYNGKECPFCSGAGKVGLNKCVKCNGEKRILGKQKLKGIKLEGDETKIKSMGHYGKGRIGDLIIKV